jgi:hypothetical protein
MRLTRSGKISSDFSTALSVSCLFVFPSTSPGACNQMDIFLNFGQFSFKWWRNHIRYLLTPGSRALLEKLTGLHVQLVKKFPAFYLTRRFITAFTIACHLSILSQPNPVHTPTSHFLKIDPNIILPPTPGSPQWSLSLRFPHQNPIHASLLPHPRYMPRPSHSRFYHPHNMDDMYIYNCSWIDTRWQQYNTQLHTNSTQHTENGTYITIKKLNIHNNKKFSEYVRRTKK